MAKKLKAEPKPIEFKSILEEIQNLAKDIVEDYAKNPSQISGSMVQVHSDSPILNIEPDKKSKK